MECTLDQWEGNWTLVAVNPLGQHILTDFAELSHRGGCITLTLIKINKSSSTDMKYTPTSCFFSSSVHQCDFLSPFLLSAPSSTS